MSIEEYFGDWTNVVDLKEADRIIKKLSASKYIICPQLKDTFKAFRLCSRNNLRVLILGQDPYNNLRNNKPVATGIAFANSTDTPEDSYSPSLEVLKESIIDYTIPHGMITFDTSLEKLEEQGVLLLNSSLTCEVGKPNSHCLLWRPFISTFLSKLSDYEPGVVYVLMGNQAQSFEHCINHQTNYIIKEKHPAWYARNHMQMPHDVWKQINEIVKGQYNNEIEWYSEYK